MNTLIIPSKLSRPHTVYHEVIRSKIIKRMDDRHYRVIGISSQAGYGKSTLVSQWLNKRDIRNYVWYSLDEYDNDMTVFITYLTEGIKGRYPTLGQSLDTLLSQRSQLNEEQWVRMYVGLLHRLEEPLWLVFDDYHYIQSPEVETLLRNVLSFLEGKVNIVLISREKIKLNLSRELLSDRYLELNSDDLRYDTDDIQALFDLMDQKVPTYDELKKIFRITEGWAAGVKLALIVLKERRIDSLFTAGENMENEMLLRYLFEEILQEITDQEKLFLMISSVPDYFSQGMCREVFSRFVNDSERILNELIQKNLFIIEMDDECYRYHHLFRKVIQSFHKGQAGHDYIVRVDAVTLAVGDWYFINERFYEAHIHYARCKETSKVSDCLEHLWAPMDLELNTRLWLELAEKVPEEQTKKRPLLSMEYGWALIDNNRIEESLYWLDRAESLFTKGSKSTYERKKLVSDQKQYELMEVNLIKARAYIAGAYGDYDKLEEYAQRLIALMDQKTLKAYGVIMMTVGFAHWNKQSLDLAQQAIEKAISYERIYGEAVNVDNFHMVLFSLWLHQGKVRQMEEQIEKLIKDIERENRLPLIIPTLHLLLSQGAYVRNDIEMCKKELKHARVAGDRFSLPDFNYRYYAFKARVALDLGEVHQSMMYLLEAKGCYFRNPIPDFNPIEPLEEAISKRMVATPSIAEEKQQLVEPLTVREIEVLALIESGMSNKEISETLYLALSTVKGYIQNIFGKLEVRRRTEAVAKAKSMNII